VVIKKQLDPCVGVQPQYTNVAHRHKIIRSLLLSATMCFN